MSTDRALDPLICWFLWASEEVHQEKAGTVVIYAFKRSFDKGLSKNKTNLAAIVWKVPSWIENWVRTDRMGGKSSKSKRPVFHLGKKSLLGGRGWWDHAWQRWKQPSEYYYKNHWRGKKDKKATTFAANREPCIINASKSWQDWEGLQKILTKLGNQTTMTEKVQCTQMPKQVVLEKNGQASYSDLEVVLWGSAADRGNDCSSITHKRPAPWVSMENMSLYNLGTHHRPCPLACCEAGPKETL